MKAEKAFEYNGPAFLNVLTPCPVEWKFSPAKSIEITKLASDVCAWPIFEVEKGGAILVNYKPGGKRPVTDWIKLQGRFKHLLHPENKWILEEIQDKIDQEWEWLCLSKNKVGQN
jgi:pyruvate ferredoxin oxidoreductase beta subunit